MPKRILVWMAFLGLLLASPKTHATIIVKLDDQQMAQKAHTVVQGRVLRVVARWDAKVRRIYTFVTLAVTEYYKGDKTVQEVTIRQSGGAINSIGSYVPGTATFKVGEDVLVFLEPQKDKRYFHVMGMSYGKYSIVEDPKDQKRYVVRNTKGLAVGAWNPQGRFKVQHIDPKSLKPVLFESFVQKLRTYLKPIKAAPLKPDLKVTPSRP
ncbi:MAG: hypothetical protein H6728_12355 [Myxococcales bacterium]|nr:hypothetical protein [Myxococcales bacterium]